MLADFSTVANELPENGFVAKGGANVERSPATDIFYIDTIPGRDTGATRYCGFRTPEQTSTAAGTASSSSMPAAAGAATSSSFLMGVAGVDTKKRII